MGVGEEDLIGGVVDGQRIGPLQFGGDDGRGIGAVHANSANVRSVPPVCPVQPSNKAKETGKWTNIYSIYSTLKEAMLTYTPI